MPTETIVPVLLYHSITPERAESNDRWAVPAAQFRQDMQAVAESGRVPLTARQLGACLRGQQPLPDRSIAVTFDDGFADFADVAMPVLEQLNLAATLFVTSGYLGRRAMLSRTALRDVAAVPSVEIGAHSVTHPHLDVLGAQAARREIVESRQDLEDEIGMPVESFAYPHGSYSSRTRSLIASAGLSNAHAVKNALSHSCDDALAVGRFTVHGRTSRAQVCRVIDGAGVPMSWRRERWRTRGYRLARRMIRPI